MDQKTGSSESASGDNEATRIHSAIEDPQQCRAETPNQASKEVHTLSVTVVKKRYRFRRPASANANPLVKKKKAMDSAKRASSSKASGSGRAKRTASVSARSQRRSSKTTSKTRNEGSTPALKSGDNGERKVDSTSAKRDQNSSKTSGRPHGSPHIDPRNLIVIDD